MHYYQGAREHIPPSPSGGLIFGCSNVNMNQTICRLASDKSSTFRKLTTFMQDCKGSDWACMQSSSLTE